MSSDNEDNDFVVAFEAHYKDPHGQWQLMGSLGTKDGFKMTVDKMFKFRSFCIDDCENYCYGGTFYLSFIWR